MQKNNAASRAILQTKIHLLQHLLVLQSRMQHESYVARQKLSAYLVFQLVARHHLNACDISILACDKVRLIQV